MMVKKVYVKDENEMTNGVVVNGECNGAQLNGNATSATTNGGNKHGKKLSAF